MVVDRAQTEFRFQGPVLLVHGKVAAQVKQGLLADLVAVTPEPNQAGEVLIAVLCGSGLGAPEEHGRRIADPFVAWKAGKIHYGTTFYHLGNTITENLMVRIRQTYEWLEKRRNLLAIR